LRRGGQFLNVDCQPAREKHLARRQFEAWKAHLMRVYSERQAEDFLAAWSQEDVYFPLDAEMQLMQDADFAIEILWRKDAFAVLVGRRR